jgi:hypothetical protein
MASPLAPSSHLSDLVAFREFLQKFFQQKTKRKLDTKFLSDSDLIEIRSSLFHLGKAIHLFHLQKGGQK